jgi:hypothetical protein
LRDIKENMTLINEEKNFQQSNKKYKKDPLENSNI